MVLLLLIAPSTQASLCVEDNTLKCAELGYTESSCPYGGVACQYDTSLWYCAKWTCEDGRLYSANNKPANTECIETAYKNMTCYDCKENSCSSKNCAIGDVYYSDGTCCPVENFDCKKTPVGVVYALSETKGGVPYTTAEAEAEGFTSQHGRVINLRDLTPNSSTYAFDPTNPYDNRYKYLHFGLYSTDVSGLTNYSSAALMLTAFQENDAEIYSGKENTAKFVSATPAYSYCTLESYTEGTANYNRHCAPTAAKAALAFYPPEVASTDAIVGAGNWYLPAIGELALLYGIDVSAMTSGTSTTGATGTTKTIVNNTLTALQEKGVYAKTLTDSYYWSSVEFDSDYSWDLIMTNGDRHYGIRGTSYVRVSLAF